MGIDHLQLSPVLIAALYPETLVAGNDPFLGKNLRSVGFLVHHPDLDYLPEEQFIFLGKMLTACKYHLDDIALVNTARLNLSFDELKKLLTPQIIFLWGIPPGSVGLSSELHDFSVTLIDGISVVPVPSPGLMSGNDPAGQELKQRLWVCLKKLFTL
jgi:hypothetical protein